VKETPGRREISTVQQHKGLWEVYEKNTNQSAGTSLYRNEARGWINGI
jgi:hypothetical protein